MTSVVESVQQHSDYGMGAVECLGLLGIGQLGGDSKDAVGHSAVQNEKR